MAERILIMGLPGAGKTYLAQYILEQLQNAGKSVTWLNADDIRSKYNDWDFSREGRIRQSLRMRELADAASTHYAMCDFVAPLPEQRNNFKADWTIWVDTIDAGRYEDTNRAFVPPDVYDFRITEQNSEKWSEFIAHHILGNFRRPVFDPAKETVQLLGRFQPWHAGHRALFDRAMEKTGQVCVMVRDCQGWQGTNPFTMDQVCANIRRDLDPIYQGKYTIMPVPNIVNITYGRDVGYAIEREEFDAEIESITATKIRANLGLK